MTASTGDEYCQTLITSYRTRAAMNRFRGVCGPERVDGHMHKPAELENTDDGGHDHLDHAGAGPKSGTHQPKPTVHYETGQITPTQTPFARKDRTHPRREEIPCNARDFLCARGDLNPHALSDTST
jgi:hypothetical protein